MIICIYNQLGYFFQLSERSFFLARLGVCQRTGSDRVMSARLLDARLGDEINANVHYREAVTQQTAVCRHNPEGRVQLRRISLFPQPRCSTMATPSAAASRAARKRIPARRARCSDSLLKAKLCGSGPNGPLSTDLCRLTPPEKIRSGQVAFESRARLGTVRSSCKIRVLIIYCKEI